MLVKLRFELDQRKFNEEWDKYIDRIHETFKTEMGDQLANSGPIETGEMRANWDYKRNSKHVSTISNSTPQAGYLQGTGLWGPHHQKICARGVQFEGTYAAVEQPRFMHFFWRYLGYKEIWARCVKGINPHEVHGMQGQVYDFIGDMNTAIRRGWDRTKEAV
jgi:hypothetical protein